SAEARPPSAPAIHGRRDSNQMDAIAPSSATPPRWPALMSANTGGKYIATTQKTGAARLLGLHAMRKRMKRPASSAAASMAAQTCTPTSFGNSATGIASRATGGGLTNA